VKTCVKNGLFVSHGICRVEKGLGGVGTFSHYLQLKLQKFKFDKGTKMKISVKKNVLEIILANTNNYLDKKDSSIITSQTLVRAKDGEVTLTATDNEIGLAFKAECETEENGEFVVNGKQLLNIVKILKDGDITLERSENAVVIKQNNLKYKLPVQNADEFPAFPSTDGKSKFNIHAVTLSKNLKRIQNAIDQASPKKEITGALIDIKEEFVNLVATDSRTLYVYRLENTSSIKKQLIVPKKAIPEIQKIFLDTAIEIYYDDNIFMAIGQNFEFFTKIINGTYPNYERIGQGDYTQSLELSKAEFVEGIKAINAVSEETKISFSEDGSVAFESVSENGEEAFLRCENSVKGVESEFAIVLKNRYILDFLGNIDGENFTLKFKGKGSPVKFEAGENGEFTDILMAK